MPQKYTIRDLQTGKKWEELRREYPDKFTEGDIKQIKSWLDKRKPDPDGKIKAMNNQHIYKVIKDHMGEDWVKQNVLVSKATMSGVAPPPRAPRRPRGSEQPDEPVEEAAAPAVVAQAPDTPTRGGTVFQRDADWVVSDDEDDSVAGPSAGAPGASAELRDARGRRHPWGVSELENQQLDSIFGVNTMPPSPNVLVRQPAEARTNMDPQSAISNEQLNIQLQSIAPLVGNGLAALPHGLRTPESGISMRGSVFDSGSSMRSFGSGMSSAIRGAGRQLDMGELGDPDDGIPGERRRARVSSPRLRHMDDSVGATRSDTLQRHPGYGAAQSATDATADDKKKFPYKWRDES